MARKSLAVLSHLELVPVRRTLLIVSNRLVPCEFVKHVGCGDDVALRGDLVRKAENGAGDVIDLGPDDDTGKACIRVACDLCVCKAGQQGVLCFQSRRWGRWGTCSAG